MKKETLSRRSFLNKLWLVLGTVAFAEFIVMVLAFFKPRKPKALAADAERIIIAGPVDNFEPGTVKAFVRGKFYLARLEDGGFLAMSRTCTHLACTVPWVSKENKFICPCHSSEFDIRGPAPFHGYQRRINSSAPAILQNLTYGVRLPTHPHQGHWIFTRSVSRTTCSRWIPANSENGLYLQRTR